MKKTVLLFLLLSSFISYSQEVAEFDTDRPDQTECSTVVPLYTIQLETGISYSSGKNNNVLSHQQNYASSLIRIGAFKAMEFRLIIGEYEKAAHYVDGNKTIIEGFKPVEIGTKIKVCEEHGLIPSTAFIGHLELPFANKNYRSETVIPSFRFSMSHTLSKKMDLGYNLGMEWKENAHPDYVYTLTVARSLKEKWEAYIEWFGGFANKEIPNSTFAGGLSFLPLKNWKLDVSGGFGLNENTPDYYIATGFSIRLPH